MARMKDIAYTEKSEDDGDDYPDTECVPVMTRRCSGAMRRASQDAALTMMFDMGKGVSGTDMEGVADDITHDDRCMAAWSAFWNAASDVVTSSRDA